MAQHQGHTTAPHLIRLGLCLMCSRGVLSVDVLKRARMGRRSGVGLLLLPAPLGPLLPLLPSTFPAIGPECQREWMQVAEHSVAELCAG